MLSPPFGWIASANYLVSKQSLASLPRKTKDHVIDGAVPRIEPKHGQNALY